MTTARHAAPQAGDRHAARRAGEHHAARRAGEHRERDAGRRRLVRQELLAGLFLLMALLVTLVLLGLQWLDGGSPSSALVRHLALSYGGRT